MSDRDDAQLLRVLRKFEVPHVVIGGWAVITHGYVRFTADIDVLIPDAPDVYQRLGDAMASIKARRLSGDAVAAGDPVPESGWQLETDHGRIDILPEGAPPLDFASVQAGGLDTELDGVPVRVAGIAHIVAFKRLANRPHDRIDIAELEALHGPIPRLELPGLE